MLDAMARLRFKLTSDQLELLLEFERAQGLSQLAEVMAKDPSVVSRNLQRIAEDYPVLKKVKGRWELTPLGIQINTQTRTYLEKHSELLLQQSDSHNLLGPSFNENSTLIVINAQNGLLNATQEGRNNSQAENHITQILAQWRKKKETHYSCKTCLGQAKLSFF
jgi:hypothetical protein